MPNEIEERSEAGVNHASNEWLDHFVPLQLLRALWVALFPARFDRVVCDSLDGDAPPGFPKPIAFAVGCWLLLYAVVQAFPWAFSTTGINPLLSVLPPVERRAVASRLGITAVPGLVLSDSVGYTSLGKSTRAAATAARARIGKKVGRITASDVAVYLETHGESDLALRVRGYAARANEKPTPVDQTTLVFFVVFGLVPGWYVSHIILHSRRRTFLETRRVHMYNDSWLLVTALAPLSVATYAGEAFSTAWPQRALATIGALATLVWAVRTVRLYAITHDAPAWRTAAAHVIGLAVALVMAILLSASALILRGTVQSMLP